MTEELRKKEENLRQYLRTFDHLAVAFSSGVDSTYLLKVAKEELKDNVLAITAKSAWFPEREFTEADEFCKAYGIDHIVCAINELEIEGFCDNPKNRCYICKKELFQRFIQEAKNRGIFTVAEGSNMDDLGDYRPGLKAVEELGIVSPLRHAGLTKSDIRLLSKEMGLPTWEKNSYACLASRFVYGEKITEEKLKMVEEAEELLISMGFGQMRVRIHGSLARIEVLKEDFVRLQDTMTRDRIVNRFKELGFSYITMDLQGYRTGSMNEGFFVRK